MNERMKDFYDQVGLDFENFQRVTVTKGDMEKFAELIVKETMRVVANQLPSNQYLDVAHAVIEHFKDADVT